MGQLLKQTAAQAELSAGCSQTEIKPHYLVSLQQSIRTIKAPLPEFQKIKLADQNWITPILAAENSLSTDGCFGTFYLWGDSFGQTVAQSGNRLLVHYNVPEQPFFAYPSGSGSLDAAISIMEQKAAAADTALVIKGVTEAQKEVLEKEWPGYFVFSESRENADYIYEVEMLASLLGRKLHGKRNHCHRFEQNWPEWRFEELQRAHFSKCIALLDYWEGNHAEKAVNTQAAERFALERVFTDYEKLNLEGGALFIGEKLVAFTIGEPIGENGFDIHFEKAIAEINGAYSMINREFVRFLSDRHPELHYINREEDLGLENLRKAKESYRPAFLLKKYIAQLAPKRLNE
ncbi:MAG: hypothetical protein K0R55_1205 [Sporomusa sp.]|jgi:hypothetical protein|nr:hypothetical protein [Sporomusa sp.]